MNYRFPLAIVGLAAVTTSIALAQAPQQPQPNKPAPAPPRATPPRTAPPAAQQPPMELPPGWTEADMQACIEAGTPGQEHAKLAEGTGVWTGKSTCWMAPGAEPKTGTITSTCTPTLGGRYLKCEMSGDMPDMGPFNGFGIYGFDNTKNEYQAVWIDDHSTNIYNGTGLAASDGKTMTWKYSYVCPVSKKPTTLREVHTWTGKEAQTMEIYGVEPKTGKEFKMMEVALTRKPGTATVTGSER